MAESAKRDYDVIVIGAGVLGVFHAYFAAMRGLRVLLIERNELPRDASVRNFGWCIPSAMPPGEWARRGQAGLEIYRALAETIDIPLSRRGTQYLASTPLESAVIGEFAAQTGDEALHCELLDARASRELNPHVRADYCLASLYFPDEIRIEPRSIFARIIPWLTREFDCDYLPQTVASSAKVQGGGCRISTADGTHHEAAHVFVCTGADVSTLFPDVFATAGLQRCKLQMVSTVPQGDWQLPTNLGSGLSIRRYPSFQNCPSWPLLANEPIDPQLEERGIHLLLVQDFQGRLIVGDSHLYSEGDFDETLDARTEELILEYAQHMIAVSDWTVERRWQGVYLMHPEQDLFTRTIDDRIHLITGIGGKGMTAAPALAREAIDRITA